MDTAVKTFNGVAVTSGTPVQFKDGKAVTPNNPIIPYIAGDGIGPEIWAATRKIVDTAVQLAYTGERSIAWYQVFAGDEAKSRFGNPLPEGTLAAIREYGVAIKGPLATPTGGGMRSLNVAMRLAFDLYQCVRPVRYYPGVPSPVVRPQDLDVVIFRENTEDIYSGIEFPAESDGAKEVIELLKKLGHTVAADSGIGIKPISRTNSKRLVRKAIQFAIEHSRTVVTLVAKGNIQKFTEGAFVTWGYEVAKDEFGDVTVTEDELWSVHGGKLPEGKILINYRITDAMFADILARPSRYSVIATTNLNGDYLSDACAAQVGGLGIAPGANLGEGLALFEATHGTAPDIAGKNLANPSSLLLSAVMMLEYLGWTEAAGLIVSALQDTIAAKTVTGDMARLMTDATKLNTDEFADAVVANLKVPVPVICPMPVTTEPVVVDGEKVEPVICPMPVTTEPAVVDGEKVEPVICPMPVTTEPVVVDGEKVEPVICPMPVTTDPVVDAKPKADGEPKTDGEEKTGGNSSEKKPASGDEDVMELGELLAVGAAWLLRKLANAIDSSLD